MLYDGLEGRAQTWKLFEIEACMGNASTVQIQMLRGVFSHGGCYIHEQWERLP